METSLEDAELERRVAERTADLEASNAATEQALRESEARFRALIENSFDITAITDGDGLIRYVSPSVERILGYQPHELEGSTFSEFSVAGSPLVSDLLTEPFRLDAAGRLAVPTGPGLGIGLNDELIERMRYTG